MKCLFWKQVQKELLNNGLGVKDLEYRTKIPYSTIINAINRNSMPKADTALKISKALNRSVEFLLGEKVETGFAVAQNVKSNEIALYRKHAKLIDALEKLPAHIRQSVEDLVQNILETESAKKEQAYHIR